MKHLNEKLEPLLVQFFQYFWYLTLLGLRI